MGIEKHKESAGYLAEEIHNLSKDYEFTHIMTAAAKYVYNKLSDSNPKEREKKLETEFMDNLSGSTLASDISSEAVFYNVRLEYSDSIFIWPHIKKTTSLTYSDYSEYVIVIPKWLKKLDGQNINKKTTVKSGCYEISPAEKLIKDLKINEDDKFDLAMVVYHETCHMIYDFIRSSIENGDNTVFTYRGEPLLEECLNDEEEFFCTEFAKNIIALK